MSSYQKILDKLNQFTKRYYTNMLVKGVLLFLSLGILLLFSVLGVEYFLWLSSTGRLLLFLLFILIGSYLLYKYIITPIFYLLKVKRGISKKEASLLIGKHFPEVDDRLINLLDLVGDKEESELLIASINQRSNKLQNVPFVNAVNFRDNFKYVKYLTAPIILFVIVLFSGNLSSFVGSYKRVVNYDLAFDPPAPFRFKMLSEGRDVLNSKSYTIFVETEGDVRPDVVFIIVDGKKFIMKKSVRGFEYTFAPPLDSFDYYFEGNGVRSRNYRLNALKTPLLQRFEMKLTFPNYINRKPEVLKGTGNAVFPEGTQVNWTIIGEYVDVIHFSTNDTILSFIRSNNQFDYSKRIYSDMSYQIASSNRHVENYENLTYSFEVIKDEYPKIRVQKVLDSLKPNVSYFVGKASDDYKLKSIKLICYSKSNPKNVQKVDIQRSNSGISEFYYTFPSGLQLNEGEVYDFYFEAIDNDAIHGGKASKSQVFSTILLDQDALLNKQLKFQESILENMDQSLDDLKEQKEVLKDINLEQKEKSEFNFNDQNQIKDFLKKQERQESLMEKYSKQLKENLDQGEKDDKLNELLKERLERQEREAQKNQKLLEELQKIADKINKVDLKKKLEDIGKKQQNSERNLEQLLELTKRYYVTEKAAQLAKDLEKLSERQAYLSEIKIGQEFSSKEQKKLNNQFNKLADELNELEKDNEALKKPVDLNIDKKKKIGVKNDQKEALEQVNKHERIDQSSESEEKEKAKKNASQKQKSAAQKMREMAEQLQQSSAAAGGESAVTEDAEMLRQILDNLVIFSFKQENLYDIVKEIDGSVSQFSGSIRKQQELKGLFEHIDDSLFSLSLRRAELSEFVNEHITEVYYNMDKTLESMAESRLIQGASYQKYVLNASNSLADFLAKILENMQQSMQMGKGQGDGQDFQLPDIIKGQGELQKKMEQMGQSGQGKQGEGQEGQQGEGKKPGEKGKSGKGKDGSNGQDGDKGEGGEGQKTGESGEGKGKGGGKGQGGSSGQGQPSEQELQELYEIYKEQQLIREQLENQLKDMIYRNDQELAKKLLRQMENFENDLIENGITQRTQNKMNNIQHELLKLENAAMKKGKKEERESKSNIELFKNPITSKPAILDDYKNEIEILNRQDLPLLQNYQNKVQQYFQHND
ncbi:hypothetical protein [Aurantibacter sp.]|uniref:hypothetical protein n=1 Tax=Aurantibacter sp. TaxID=2807103 RepID=UPI003264BE21